MIATDDAVYRLPAGATVTLLAVHAPGEWAVDGTFMPEEMDDAQRVVQRRCFEVGVAF